MLMIKKSKYILIINKHKYQEIKKKYFHRDPNNVEPALYV